MMREAKKEKIAEHLWRKLEIHKFVDEVPNCTYVLHGGALLHKLVWTKGDTFPRVIDQTVQHVLTT